jgi:hypothetical protein
MENLAIAQSFNFEENKIQAIDLNTLMLTYREDDVFGKPIKDIYHFQAVNRVLDICKMAGLTVEIQDMFAANNSSRQYPGVSTLPAMVELYGKSAPQAHILRRVYTTIAIRDDEDSELTTNIAIAYHQEGIQIAFGPCVKICHNLCILGAQRMYSNYGKDKLSNEELFQSVGEWIRNFGHYRERDQRIINKMKQIECTKSDVMQIIGILTSLRVAYDNKIGNIRERLTNYPLNQAQISIFTDNYLRHSEKHSYVTLWDVYNLATDIYHPQQTEIPNILPQTAVLFQVLQDNYSL